MKEFGGGGQSKGKKDRRIPEYSEEQVWMEDGGI